MGSQTSPATASAHLGPFCHHPLLRLLGPFRWEHPEQNSAFQKTCLMCPYSGEALWTTSSCKHCMNSYRPKVLSYAFFFLIISIFKIQLLPPKRMFSLFIIKFRSKKKNKPQQMSLLQLLGLTSSANFFPRSSNSL